MRCAQRRPYVCAVDASDGVKGSAKPAEAVAG